MSCIHGHTEATWGPHGGQGGTRCVSPVGCVCLQDRERGGDEGPGRERAADAYGDAYGRERAAEDGVQGSQAEPAIEVALIITTMLWSHWHGCGHRLVLLRSSFVEPIPWAQDQLRMNTYIYRIPNHAPFSAPSLTMSCAMHCITQPTLACTPISYHVPPWPAPQCQP